MSMSAARGGGGKAIIKVRRSCRHLGAQRKRFDIARRCQRGLDGVVGRAGMRSAPKDPRYHGPATLVLADGRVFRGLAFGAKGTCVAEVVFNTSMTGYQEVVSDPSYTDQFVCFTAPEIGNVGTNQEDQESPRGQSSGILVRSLSPMVSNWRSEASLSETLQARGIFGMAELDTRALTKHIREHGAQMAAMSTEHEDIESLKTLAAQAAPMQGRDLVGQVSTKTSFTWDAPSWGVANPPEAKYHVAVYDFGVKQNILRCLRDHGMHCTVVPASTSAKEVLALGADGIFLSNGPGDPDAMKGVIKELSTLLDDPKCPPVFGICLGHQLMCLARGGKTFKLKFGHHGANHPVLDMPSERIRITSQNHGFAVDPQHPGRDFQVTQRNLIDDTVAGVTSSNGKIFGVQYHPEAAPGPRDAYPEFARFAQIIERSKV